MKKNLLLLFVLSICIVYAKAQDLIVTNLGDSLNCKITAVNPDNVHFKVMQKEQIRTTLITKSDLKSYAYNFYSKSIVSEMKIVNTPTYSKWRYGFNIGYGYQTAKMAPNLKTNEKEFIDGLRSGLVFGADFAHYVNEKLGIGLKYTGFRTSNSMDNYSDPSVISVVGQTVTGTLNSKIAVDFFAPYMNVRLPDKNGNALIMGYAIGYLAYANKRTFYNKYNQLTGGTLGIAIDLGYDLSLSKSTALGFQVSYLGGALKQYNISSGNSTASQTVKLDKNSYEGLNRLDLTVGLKFR